jgi:DNA primase
MVDIEYIKRTVDILQIIGQNTQLKKVANTGGGEYAGSCPFCGGSDRFRVQPNNPAGGRWYCRGCGDNRWHDVIDYIQIRDGINFTDALESLSLQVGPSSKKKEPVIKKPQPDKEKWQKTAVEFWESSITHLWTDEGKSAREYLHSRGLQDDTLHRWMIGYNPTEGYGKPEEWGLDSGESVWIPRGILIPCMDAEGLHYLKIRRRVGEPKYYILKGGENWPFGLQTYPNKFDAFLFEGEFDVLLAYQTGFSGVGYASIPANQELKPEYGPFFKTLERVIVAMDNDEAGNKAAEKLCRIPQFIKANPFPDGKDLGEYYDHSGKRLDLVFEYLYTQVGLSDGLGKEP